MPLEVDEASLHRTLTTNTPRYECSQCHQTFSRVEHLTRHGKSHNKERLLKCSHCRKGFYRADALKRHEHIHKNPKRSLRGKGPRACSACVAGRRKCSGDLPCSGCERRSVDCNYPIHITAAYAQDDGRVQDQDHELLDGQDSPMAYSNTGDQLHVTTQEVHHTHQLRHQSATANLSQEFLTRSRNEANGGINTAMVGVESDASQSQLAHSLLGNVQTQILDNNPTPWYQSNFSSINWLPYDWMPDIVGEENNILLSDRPDLVSAPTDDGQSAQFPSPGLPDHSQRSLSFSELRDGRAVSSPGSKSTHSAGHYYVDGDGARLPRVLKPPYHFEDTAPLSDQSKEHGANFALPDIPSHFDATSDDPSIGTLTVEIYDEILRIFDLTCISCSHNPFSTSSLPSIQMFNHFLERYTTHFQPVLPFIHLATFRISTSHCLLIVAMAAIGSQYIEHEKSRDISRYLHEFLRRAIEFKNELDKYDGIDLLTLIQIKILNCIGILYSYDSSMVTRVKGYHYDLVSHCELLWDDARWETPLETNQHASDRWRRWSEAESCRRTGYSIWLLDCMWVFHLQMRPLLSLEDAKAPIPCQEVLWEAKTAQDWQQLYACSTSSPSLHSVVQLAYVEKRMQSSTGEFSRILCIHGLFRRTWEIEKYFSQPLTLWEPSAERQSIETIEESVPVWLPNVPTYSKWRNSTCDCLDILHWHANSVIGAASGMEHSTVLHLHLARVILLTPFREIVQLARIMSTKSNAQKDKEPSKLIRHVQRWATEDQYKARLAMIHAGVLFWHVRRYSIDAFYEPSSVFLSSLALWAYGKFAKHTTGTIRNSDRTPQDEDEEDVDSLFPSSIQLDRPADDELVQLFVKRGITMKANIMGVGNLCSLQGHVRVLKEGQKLLSGLKRWGYTTGLQKTLNTLTEVSQRELAIAMDTS